MSDIKVISPLLDDYDIGGAINEHDGIHCYPAMEKDSDGKYIVKTISIPASQTQLDALLLTGAYSDEAAALLYFKELAEATAEEIKLLNQLSQIDGFLPCEGWQIAPMDSRTGYKVYMLTPYRRTLKKSLKRKPMTHLDAVNLGLDLCAALSVCRRSGYLYVDLKPSNIHTTADGGYRIGDIGFIDFKSLKYASLPRQYRSEYTAPEMRDDFATLNSTIDIYAVGMILYQIYNAGDLPVIDESYNENGFASPAFADYEMGEIILKACHPDPDQRWQDPVEMGQALVSYMQRNSINDTPIVIPTVSEPEIAIAESAAESAIAGDDPASEELVSSETVVDSAEEITPEESVTAPEAPQYMEDEDGNISLLEHFSTDETAPENALSDVSYEEISDDFSEILMQIDALTAHPVPNPVVAPEPIEVTVSEPVAKPEEQIAAAEPEDQADTADDSSMENTIIAEAEPAADGDSAVTVLAEDAPEETETVSDPAPQASVDAPDISDMPRKKSHWLRNIFIFLLIALIAVLGYLYYTHIYLLNIDSVSVNGDDVNMVVIVDSDVDESLLSVVCADSHGHQLSAPVLNGKASFANLTPDTAYNVKVLVDGFHRLTGNTAASYSTPPQTNIVQFNAITGSESGSVILSFTVEGPESGQWSVMYSTEGEEPKTVALLSHMATITGLTVGKEYTFTLVPSDDMYVTGMTEISFTASDLIYAEDLMIISCVDNKLTATWNAPAGVEVSNWTARCYDGQNYNETTITADTFVEFEGIDPANSFTVEVTAANMSVSQRAYVSENAITVTDFNVDTSNAAKMELSWNTNQQIPEGGWIILYSIDGSDVQGSVTTDSNSAVIAPMVPNASYTFTLQDASGADVLTGHLGCQTPDAVEFSGYGVTPEHMTFKMCHRPDEEKWTRYNLSDSDFTNTFAVGEEVSILLKLSRRYAVYDDDITTLYVIRDESGKVVNYSHSTRTWDDMWYQFYCEMDVPKVPTTPGTYSMSIYFNGQYTQTLELIIE